MAEMPAVSDCRLPQHMRIVALLAKGLHERTGVSNHASTVRRVLGARDWVWRWARPPLHIADPRKPRRLPPSTGQEP